MNASAQGCSGDAVAVQILGSGGPRINPERADASYLLWIDGRARLLVDAGGGAFFHFGQTEAKLDDLSMVAITHLDVSVVDAGKAMPSTVFDRQGIRVTALGIPHGPMPTLAYRVETAGRSVVFSSDQTGTDVKFVQFAKGADALIMHLAIGAGAISPLHAAPSVVGQVARDAAPKRLILSHISIPSVALDPAIADVKKFYAGPLTIGSDLQCTSVS